jgi:hypothetical protein
VGPWRLIPFADVETILQGDQLKFARGLGHAYGLREADRHGAVAYRGRNHPIGAVTPRTMHRLNLALTCTILDANDGAPERRTFTSENAVVFAHPVGDGTFTAYEEGALLRTLRALSLDGKQKINVPTELVIADWAPALDPELASAFYAQLDQGPEGRRLALSAEWLQIANRNSTMVALTVRVVSLRSGFETLLDAGMDYRKQGGALHRLVERPTARRWSRSWSSLAGKPMSANLTALEWWFYNFGFLRNKIIHGARTQRADWQWKGESQLEKAERELRRAMRSELVRLGHDSVLKLPHSERLRARRQRELMAILQTHGF